MKLTLLSDLLLSRLVILPLATCVPACILEAFAPRNISLEELTMSRLFFESPNPTASKAEQLYDAVTRKNAEVSIKLLEDAGGPCAARDLAKQATEIVKGRTVVQVSLSVNGDRETLGLSTSKGQTSFIAGYEQSRCKR